MFYVLEDCCVKVCVALLLVIEMQLLSKPQVWGFLFDEEYCGNVVVTFCKKKWAYVPYITI